jgi:ABC-type glycerol-3-phosphate transport system substrate-binding protein
VLYIWVAEADAPLEAVRRSFTSFAAGATFDLQVTAVPPDSLRLSLLSARLAGEPLPDAVWGDQDDLADLRFDGLLAPLEPGLVDMNADAFARAASEGARADAQLWGFPVLLKDALLLYHNRALAANLPTTSDELIAQSRAALDAEQYGLVAPWAEARWLLAWYSGFGGALTSDDGERPTLNTPAMLDALNLTLELQRAAPPDLLRYREGRRLFRNGSVAFALDGDWSLPLYSDPALALDLGIAALPRVAATGRAAVAPRGASYLLVLADGDSQAQPLLTALLSHLATVETQRELATASGRLPALRAALDGFAPANAAQAAALVAAADTPGLPPTGAARCAQRAVENQLALVLAGDQPKERAPEAMQREAEACAT